MTFYRSSRALVRGLVGLMMGRRWAWSLLFVVWAGGSAFGQEEAYSPKTYDIDRYVHIWEQSPFIVETQVVTQSDGLEAKYSLTGLASVAGTPIAFIYDRGAMTRFSVAQGKTSEGGVELVSIEMDRDPRQSKATIRVGAEQAAIGYDPAALLQTAASSDSGQNPGLNPAAANNPGIVAPRPPPAPNFNAPSSPNSVQPPPAARTIKRRSINIPTN